MFFEVSNRTAETRLLPTMGPDLLEDRLHRLQLSWTQDDIRGFVTIST